MILTHECRRICWVSPASHRNAPCGDHGNTSAPPASAASCWPPVSTISTLQVWISVWHASIFLAQKGPFTVSGACSLGVPFGDANIVHTLGQCIWDGRAHYTFHQVKERYLGYLGIIPNLLGMGTIWVVSLGWPRKKWGLQSFWTMVWYRSLDEIPTSFSFSFPPASSLVRRSGPGGPRDAANPKKNTSCDSFLVNYISLQQIILLQAVDKFQVYLSHLDSTNTFWYDYDPNQ